MNIEQFLNISIEVETDLKEDQFTLLSAGTLTIKLKGKEYNLDTNIVGKDNLVGETWLIDLKVIEDEDSTDVSDIQDLDDAEIEVFLGQDELPEKCYFDIQSAGLFYKIDECTIAKDIKVDY